MSHRLIKNLSLTQRDCDYGTFMTSAYLVIKNLSLTQRDCDVKRF